MTNQPNLPELSTNDGEQPSTTFAGKPNLAAVGATSTTQLTRTQHADLMQRLGRYPDSPKWKTRAERRVLSARGRVDHG